MFSIEITGLDETIAMFTALEAALPDTLEAVVYDASTTLLDETASYPPQRPTKYVRTGTYGREQHVTAPYWEGYTVTGAVIAPTPYAIFVRGTSDGGYRQASVHAGYWEPLIDLTARVEPAVVDHAQNAVDALIAGVGFVP